MSSYTDLETIKWSSIDSGSWLDDEDGIRWSTLKDDGLTFALSSKTRRSHWKEDGKGRGAEKLAHLSSKYEIEIVNAGALDSDEFSSEGSAMRSLKEKQEREAGDARPEGKAAGSKKKRKRNPTEEEIMARLARKRAKQNRELESRVLSQKLAEHGLSLVEIPADGHCLFAAISDQLKRSARHGEVIHNYKSLRRLACDYMLKVSWLLPCPS